MRAICFSLLMLSCVIMEILALHLIEIPPMECSQEGVECRVQVGNCSDEGWVVPRYHAPGFPDVTAKIEAKRDDTGQFAPFLLITWSQLPDSSILTLKGTEVRVVEMSTNHSVCVRYIFCNTTLLLTNPGGDRWTFSLERIVVIPNFKYQVFVTNLPKSDIGSYQTITNITVPEHIWDPKEKWSVSKCKENGDLVITIEFEPVQFSDQYKVSICSLDLYPDLVNSTMPPDDNKRFLRVNFPLEACRINHCILDLVIQPLSLRSMNNFLEYRGKVDICPLLPGVPVVFIILVTLVLLLALLAAAVCIFGCIRFLKNKDSHKETPSSDSSTCAKDRLEWNPIQEPKRVIIIYSLDHPLYKEIVLKLCAFMRAKCGTDITLDLLDAVWLSTIGRIQWLDMQRERISKSSDKVLILCSPGVLAKWKAMCGEHKVRLKEDECSPIGDMLTPALSLIIPDFVHASSFYNYMVAYFDDVCSEDDVPAPFNVVVKYKLMKHFEELYFRILDMEKHEPGRTKCIEGIRENDFFCCPSGQGLQNAIEAFKNYQLKNPNWFEMELLDTDDEEEESTFPTDINYGSVTECHLLFEGYKAHTCVNMIKHQNDEHVLKSSIAETAIILSENSSVLTTDVYSSGPVSSSY
ncbi:interleukin-17 receptor A-like [Carassius auratus]|uniref:Interleukin-17 receptor A-like n=1 Tax=Carassius auratus TaxID=7957 RepID=A0A6P6MDP0_CARAU|nr:interleukin-17 receptor A-like [Carassius auratus]